ncbi:hypothetical protein L0337_14445 [candidate division KSB1 bacterium]|nr:hypothetical protein [candidate division KSB1 bacterium]
MSFTLSAKICLWKTGKAIDKLRYYFCLGLSRKILGSISLITVLKESRGRCVKKNNCFGEIRRPLAIYFSFCTFFTRHLRYLPIKKESLSARQCAERLLTNLKSLPSHCCRSSPGPGNGWPSKLRTEIDKINQPGDDGNQKKGFACAMLGNDGNTFYVHEQILVLLPRFVFADYFCLGYFINDQPISMTLLRTNFHRPFHCDNLGKTFCKK